VCPDDARLGSAVSATRRGRASALTLPCGDYRSLAQGKPRKRVERRALKRWLNHEVAGATSVEEFDARDEDGEIKSWLQKITTLARGNTGARMTEEIE